ncbi:hypothetical protein J2046_006794 [Rhizobium petrolearium]|nr:hypothetical protein [Neorhizobium petrolearium]
MLFALLVTAVARRAKAGEIFWIEEQCLVPAVRGNMVDGVCWRYKAGLFAHVAERLTGELC